MKWIWWPLKQNQNKQYQLIMIIVIVTLALIFSVFILHKFYLKPKRQIKHYLNAFRNLGMTVFEQPFAFMGVSLVNLYKKGQIDHNDAMYMDRTVCCQVDIMIGNILDKVFIGFVNPDLIKDFLSGNTPYIYPKYQLTARGQRAFFGNGLAFVQGDAWKNKRKLLSKTFNFDLIKGNIPKIVQICNKALDRFELTKKIGDNTYQYSPLNFGSRVFNNVMLKCLFGTDNIQGTFMGQPFNQFVNTTIKSASVLSMNSPVAVLGKYAWKFGLTESIREAKKRLDLLRQKSKEIVKELTAKILSQPRKEVCNYLLESLIYEKLDNKGQVSLTDQQLIDEFQGFLAAGTDTTAHFINMIIFYLSNNPLVMKRLREDINAVIKSDQDITYENLKKITYIDWIQNETTRMYGPGVGILPRIAIEDNHINGIPISKGTIAAYNSKGNHYNPKYFKDPYEFRPERWQSECNGIHPYAFIGFSAGARTCIGKQFAYLQSKIALIKLIKRYATIKAPSQVSLKIIFVYQADPYEAIFIKNPMND